MRRVVAGVANRALKCALTHLLRTRHRSWLLVGAVPTLKATEKRDGDDGDKDGRSGPAVASDPLTSSATPPQATKRCPRTRCAATLAAFSFQPIGRGPATL